MQMIEPLRLAIVIICCMMAPVRHILDLYVLCDIVLSSHVHTCAAANSFLILNTMRSHVSVAAAEAFGASTVR